MSKSDLQKEIVKTTEELPEFLVKEILDFAEFLLKKRTIASVEHLESELETMSKSETLHLEEEFFNYKNNFPKVND